MPASEGTVTPLRSALTARGITVLAGSAVTAGAGLALGYPELAALGAAGLAAVAAAVLAVARAPSLRVERLVTPSRVARGAKVTAKVTLRNDTRATAPAVTARDVAGPRSEPFPIPRLRPGQVHVGEVELPTSRRGVVMSGPLLIDRDDPFGLAHRRLDTGTAEPLFVRPRPVHLPEIAASLARSVDGPQADTTMEGTLAFHALRDYLPGDELRHVHWRASAHAGKLVVKQHVDTAQPTLAVVLDELVAGGEQAAQPDRGSEAGSLPAEVAEAFEIAVDCAASVAVVAAQHSYPLILTGSSGRPLISGGTRRSASHSVDDVLDSLTAVRPAAGQPPEAGDPLPGTLRRLAGQGRGGLAVVVSTRPTQALAAPLQLLAGSYARVVAVHAIAGPVRTGGAARAGRVMWVSVRRPEDLAAAWIRSRSAA